MNKTTKAENQHPYNLEVLRQRIEDLESIIQGYQNVIAKHVENEKNKIHSSTPLSTCYSCWIWGNILQGTIRSHKAGIFTG
ncbi:MAG: hypothetical protein IPL71_04605 [Anaerolineales bacterium]|uniref:hypothetical protein n=1 Tax=Candidatus Villigracilis proximus TaxID=3140683 RepID=UPI0031346F64|nr:hypothetical protein [Anaerolineales bacterium]